MLWLAIHGRLSTQERLAKRYPGKQMNCPLCRKEMDSNDHLFFNCEYSKKKLEKCEN